MTISATLPDITTYSSQSPRLTDTVMIHASTAEKYSYPEHATPYLLVSNFVNKGNYVLNRRPVEISASHFYFLNPNDRLEIRFSTAAPLQTCMILFEEKFMGSCFHYLYTSAEQLLDSPDGHPPIPPRFADVPFTLTDTIKRQMFLLAGSRKTQNVVQPAQDVIQEILFELITECTRLNTGAVRDIDKIAAVKKSTREELYRRLYLSREWIDDNLTSRITLDQMAGMACLNKFHFLSGFKQVFHTTPRQYLIERRLQKAYDLLKHQQHTVTDTCYLLGFESIGSFSNQFRKRFGIPPSGLLENRIPPSALRDNRISPCGFRDNP
jgi:AraC family transcriptional regulator